MLAVAVVAAAVAVAAAVVIAVRCTQQAFRASTMLWQAMRCVYI
jgi:hypothetical protein